MVLNIDFNTILLGQTTNDHLHGNNSTLGCLNVSGNERNDNKKMYLWEVMYGINWWQDKVHLRCLGKVQRRLIYKVEKYLIEGFTRKNQHDNWGGNWTFFLLKMVEQFLYLWKISYKIYPHLRLGITNLEDPQSMQHSLYGLLAEDFEIWR